MKAVPYKKRNRGHQRALQSIVSFLWLLFSHLLVSELNLF